MYCAANKKGDSVFCHPLIMFGPIIQRSIKDQMCSVRLTCPGSHCACLSTGCDWALTSIASGLKMTTAFFLPLIFCECSIAFPHHSNSQQQLRRTKGSLSVLRSHSQANWLESQCLPDLKAKLPASEGQKASPTGVRLSSPGGWPVGSTVVWWETVPASFAWRVTCYYQLCSSKPCCRDVFSIKATV